MMCREQSINPSKFPLKMESWLGMLLGQRPNNKAQILGLYLASPRCLALESLGSDQPEPAQLRMALRGH